MITIEHYLSYRQKEKQPLSMRERMARFNNKIPVLDPYRTFYNCWRVVMTIVIVFFLFEIPLLLGFTEDCTLRSIAVYLFIIVSQGYFLVFVLASVLLFLDIIINLNLGYYQKGLFVGQRWEIFSMYARFDLYVDLFCVIIVQLTYFYYSLALNIIKLLFILKVRQLAKYDEQYLYLLSTYRLGKACYKFFRLVAILLFYSHILACIFFLIDYTFYLENYNGYVDKGYLWLLTAQCMNNIVGQYGWSGRYLYALYWSIGTVSTVGYGDIFPANPWENLYELIVIINICVLFGYFVNNVFQILTQYNAVNSKLRRLQHNANFYFEQKRVSMALRYKIRRYLQFTVLEEGQRDREEEQEILSKFSSAALKKICYEQYKEFLHQLPFYDISENAKLNISAEIKLVTHFEDDLVCEDTECIYYLQKGKIVEYYECGLEKYPMRILTPIMTIKMYEFCTGINSGRTYRSKRYTEMLQLSRKSCLENFAPKLRQQFWMLKQLILLQGNLAVIRIECSICRFQHMEGECPKLHYVSEHYRKWDDGWWNSRIPAKRRSTRSQRYVDFSYHWSVLPFEQTCANYEEYRSKYNIDTLAHTRCENLG